MIRSCLRVIRTANSSESAIKDIPGKTSLYKETGMLRLDVMPVNKGRNSGMLCSGRNDLKRRTAGMCTPAQDDYGEHSLS